MGKDLDPRENMSKSKPKLLNRITYPAGKTIIKQGDEGVRAYYIESGSVEILIEDGHHQLRVSELKAGDIFGEMALINKEARSATVRALEPVVLTVISSKEFEKRLEKVSDRAMKALTRVLVQRLRTTTKGQMEQYKQLTGFQDRICGIVDKVGSGIKQQNKDAFREEVTPLLDDLQAMLERYKNQ